MAIGNRDAVGPRHVVRRARSSSWSAPSIGGLLLAVLGMVGVVVSLFMAWRAGGLHPSDVPASFLWDHNATGSPSMLVWLIPIAAVIGIGALVPGAGALRSIGGLAALVVVGAFAWQVHRLLEHTGVSLGDGLDTGWYFAAVGALLACLSGMFSSGWIGGRVEREYSDDGERA